jgi:hypothetical protein
MSLLRPFDGKLLDLLKWLGTHYATVIEIQKLIVELQSVGEPLDTHDGLKARLVVLFKLAKLGVTFTETTVDDEAVKTVEQIMMNDQLLSGLAELIHRFRTVDGLDFLAVLQSPDAESLKAEFEARGINWAKLWEIAKQILPYLLPLILSEKESKDAA